MMHSVEGADHVGAVLREARETTGQTVGDIAETLRIRRVYLEAIENGRFDELPGATYALGFVRSYAAYLNLDAPGLVARFKEEASGIQVQQELEFPTPLPEGRFPGGLLVTICLLLAGVTFGGWYLYQSQNGIEVVRVPAPPSEAAGMVEAPADPPETAPANAAVASVVNTQMQAASVVPNESEVAAIALGTGADLSGPAAEVSAQAEAPQPSAVEVVVRTTPAPAASPPSPTFSKKPANVALPSIQEPSTTAPAIAADRQGRTFGAQNASARIILRARENTWVQVRDKDEGVVLTQMLGMGDRYMVPNRDDLRLMTGNAGGLEILVDGEAVPPVGAQGESRRDVRLDPARLRAGTAVFQ